MTRGDFALFDFEYRYRSFMKANIRVGKVLYELIGGITIMGLWFDFTINAKLIYNIQVTELAGALRGAKSDHIS